MLSNNFGDQKGISECVGMTRGHVSIRHTWKKIDTHRRSKHRLWARMNVIPAWRGFLFHVDHDQNPSTFQTEGFSLGVQFFPIQKISMVKRSLLLVPLYLLNYEQHSLRSKFGSKSMPWLLGASRTLAGKRKNSIRRQERRVTENLLTADEVSDLNVLLLSQWRENNWKSLY